MKNFVIIGVGGYIAPRHLMAIKETGNNLLAAYDKQDSVGVLDNYFPEANFFTEFERLDRHCEKLKRQGIKIDYVSVCSPNYLHDAHIRFGLRIGADVICEKPIVLNPWNINALSEIEKETNKKVFCILQLRLHDKMVALKKKIEADEPNKKYEVTLSNITSRGNWYHNSWKGDVQKSGGIATNIGIHFFDILLWIFGQVLNSELVELTPNKASGILYFKNAKVNWFLSIDKNDLPIELQKAGITTQRKIIINGETINFDDGFTNLHTKSYQQIIEGNGFDLENARSSIEMVSKLRK